MIRRIAQLHGLIGKWARALLGLTALLLTIERLTLAAGALGIARGVKGAWATSIVVLSLWTIRGLVRQLISADVRRRITMRVAERAFAGPRGESVLQGADADAAVFEGRQAAEQIVVRHLPSFVGETVAGTILLVIVRPANVSIFVVVGTIGATGVALASMRRPNARRQKEAWDRYVRVADDALTAIRGAPEILASGHQASFLERLRHRVDEWIAAAIRAERSAALFQRMPMAALVLVAVALFAQAAELESVLRLAIFLPPLVGLTRALFEFVRTAPTLEVLGPCLDAKRAGEHPTGASQPPRAPSEIRFEGVTFAYDGVPALTNVSFLWKAGSILALRGPNGSGKSTAMKLLLGLIAPNEGRILVDGQDLRSLDLDEWRRSMAYVAQRPYLPEDSTVFEAMQLVLPDLTETDAEQALVRTNAWDLLLRRSANTASSPLAIRMSTLSVGARQRVFLARAFARPRQVILLDEPDENLDQGTLVVLRQLVANSETAMVAIATHDDSLLASAGLTIDLTGL